MELSFCWKSKSIHKSEHRVHRGDPVPGISGRKSLSRFFSGWSLEWKYPLLVKQPVPGARQGGCILIHSPGPISGIPYHELW